MLFEKNSSFIKKKLNKYGFVIIKDFFNDSPEFINFKNYLNFTLQKVANQKKYNKKNIDLKISKIFKKNKKISAYLNDNINLSTQLYDLLSSKKLTKLISYILKKDKKEIIFNNQRFRIQIPGNDDISNLPWHQDSHYNQISKTKSLVAWISIGDIEKNMGPLIFKEKSHKLGKMKRINYFRKNGAKTYRVEINNSKLKKLKNFQSPTKSGDLILIDMLSVHTSGNNLDKYKIKYSAQVRFHVLKKFD